MDVKVKVKETNSTVKNNVVGAIVGAVGGWLIAVKAIKTENVWFKGGLALVGAVAGAITESKIKAKKGVPTAKTVGK